MNHELLGLALALLAGAGFFLYLSWASLPRRVREPLAAALVVAGALLTFLGFSLPPVKAPQKKKPQGKKKSDVVRDEAGRVRVRASLEAEKKADEINKADRLRLVQMINDGHNKPEEE